MIERPTWIEAETWEVRPIEGGGYDLLINGERFPWHIAAEGPRVQGGDYQILWVPVLVLRPLGDGPVPPDADPVPLPDNHHPRPTKENQS